ncbi:MAG: GlxA family transcriptional regulator [Alphaproteobacteria bacterium]
MSTPEHIGFLLVDRYSLIAFASAIDPLRLANRLSEKPLYTWTTIAHGDKIVDASNGFKSIAEHSTDESPKLDRLFVVSGVDVHTVDPKPLVAWLRKIERMGTVMGAICTGAHLLAKAGLLDGYRCTIHWENLPAFQENFPEVEASSDIYEIDRSRYTCSGGTAALDMMLNIIATGHGPDLAAKVADQFIHDRIRDHHDHQRSSLPARLGIRHSKLLAVVALMEQHLEEPLTRVDLAREANLSTRQLERLFRRYLQRSPARFYLELRLNKARLLLLQTNMSIIDVALACGFVSASHFSKCYRDYFGKTPRNERALPQGISNLDEFANGEDEDQYA